MTAKMWLVAMVVFGFIAFPAIGIYTSNLSDGRRGLIGLGCAIVFMFMFFKSCTAPV